MANTIVYNFSFSIKPWYTGGSTAKGVEWPAWVLYPGHTKTLSHTATKAENDAQADGHAESRSDPGNITRDFAFTVFDRRSSPVVPSSYMSGAGNQRQSSLDGQTDVDPPALFDLLEDWFENDRELDIRIYQDMQIITDHQQANSVPGSSMKNPVYQYTKMGLFNFNYIAGAINETFMHDLTIRMGPNSVRTKFTS